MRCSSTVSLVSADIPFTSVKVEPESRSSPLARRNRLNLTAQNVRSTSSPAMAKATHFAKCVALAIAGELVLLTFWAVRLRRFLLASGELRLSGSTLTLVKGMSALTRDTVELQRITSYPGGANVEMAFPAGKIRLQIGRAHV